MKKVFTILLILVLISLFVFILFLNRKIEISNLKYLNLYYSGGYDIYGYSYYKINYENGNYKLIIKPYGVSNEEEKEYDFNKDDVIKIEEILNKYNVGSWDGFNKYDNNVLDGSSFNFNVKYKDDKEINAKGYMMYPKNYHEVMNELNMIFSKYEE